MIMWNGLDSTKEHMYSSGHWEELAARGISTLMVDCPGSGEALRLQGLTARVDTEAWAAACVDYLLDPERCRPRGHRPRRLVPRRLLRATRRRLREAARPRAWPGAPTTTGARCSAAGCSARGSGRCRTTGITSCGCGATTDLDEFIEFADQVNLDGVVEQITVPFLIAHGAERPADPARVRPPIIRPGRDQPQARTAHLHCRGGRHRAHRAGPPARTSVPSSPTGWPTRSPS